MKKRIFSLILVLSIVLGAINPIFTQTAIAAQDQDIIPIVNGEPKKAPTRSDGLGYFRLDLNINPVLRYKQGKVKEGEPEAFYVVRSGEKITLKDELPEIEVGEGFIFKGWLPATRSYITASFEEAKDEITVSGSLHSSVGNDITYKAMYSKAVIMNFDPGKHGKIVSGPDKITLEFETLRGSTHFNEESPKVEVNNNSFWEFTGWTYRLPNSFTLDGDIGSSRSFTNKATYKYIGPEIVPQPGDDKPDVPENFVLVEFLPGEHGTLSGTTKYWVNPEAGKILADITPKPKVTANEGFRFTIWDKSGITEITGALKVTANYEELPTPDNEKYEPETDPIVKEPGEPTTEEEVIDKVKIPNYPEDKEDPKITVKNPDDLPDGKTPGEYEIPVVVEYPDGSEDETTVTVIVKDKPDNEKYEPETDPIVKEPGEPTTEEEVIDKVKIPGYPEDKEDPKITVENPDDLPDGETPGEYEVPVIVEYPDGSKDKTTVTVIVKDKPDNEKYEPETDPIVKEPGEPTTEEEVIDKVRIPGYPEDKEDPKITVKNPDDLPDGETPGEYEIPVVVEYPDGSKDETTVTVVVKDKEKVVLTFDPNGGTWSDDSTSNKYVEAKKGDEITILEAPTREGYKFLYWEGSVYQPGDKYTAEADHTFVAKWEKIETPTPGEGDDDQTPAPGTGDDDNTGTNPTPEKSKTPTVDKITDGDKEITGKGEPESQIIVELPDGTKITGKVDENGNWTVEIPADKTLKANDRIKVTQTEKGKTVSNIIEIVVSKKSDQKVDEKETEKPGKDGKAAPKTGDAGVILTSAVTLLSSAAYVFTKKRKED
ncbi:Rib/alpha-like domain-containing protein [Helcococcus massiliensis]|uniref:Rib/alpha-like domain-containing protein n=1 Tax=Helcococcus massiliensis TaxID=2040290 RepID=UPI000CDECE7E|nr:Rib/alpha-like domain-containing protein [Helcococcus massiliensis]